MIEMYSPLRTASEMSSSTCVVSSPRVNDFETLSIERYFSLMLLPSTVRRAAGDGTRDQRDGTIEQEADHADVHEREDDVADARGVPRIPDEEADADAADQHLGRNDREPR